MHEACKFHMQIGDHVKLAKSMVIFIIHGYNKRPKHSIRLTKLVGQPFKLDNSARKLFIRHIEQNLCHNLKALGTSLKSGQNFS